ncbi:MAG: OmpH family outer membrane protein [Breznakibacter sp.]
MEKSTKIGLSILSVAVIVLFILQFASCPKKAAASDEAKESGGTGVVFINTDSLLLNYDFAKDLNEELIRKEEKSRADFNEQAKVFQQDLNEFQRKVQNNGFLSLDRAKQEEQRLGMKERELQELNAKLSNQLMQEQNAMNKQLRDTLVNFIKEIQPQMGFEMVLSNTLGDNVLYGEKKNDITKHVIESLNARYTKWKKK